MKKNLLIDFQNLAFRVFFAIPEKDLLKLEDNLYSAISLAISKFYYQFNPDKVVFCFDSTSWRKDYLPVYKANRIGMFKKTEGQEKEEQELIFGVIDKFKEFFEKTNVYVLKHDRAESDDLIALWCESHKEDKNIIVSNDSDFYQLLSDSTIIFNPSNEMIISNKGVYDLQYSPQQFTLDNNGKVKIGKEDGIQISDLDNWIDFTLFVKLIRGDTSDNIFPSYPGVRMKSSSKKVGIMEAFKGRKEKNFDYLNFMESEWDDHEGNKRIVKEEFEKNNTLINLRAQPEDIKKDFNDYIKLYENSKIPNTMVGAKVMRFVNEHNIETVEGSIEGFAEIFNKNE